MNFGRTIIELLRKRLNEEVKSNKPDSRMFRFKHKIENFIFDFKIYDFDKLSYVFENLKIANDSSNVQLSEDDLKKRAEGLKDKATYLLEALDVVEVDAINSKVLLRSDISSRKEEPLSYFEVVFYGTGTISVDRYSYNNNKNGRKRVSFHLTSEVLEKFINNLVEAVQN